MRLLVAIASYGIGNDRYLFQLVSEYKSMSFDVDIVVISNLHKEVAPGVEVLVVDLAGKDPWSLPFAHKQLFAARLNDYDLFIYSEDDTLIREKNLQTFLELSAVLPDNEIPGFLRFERSPDSELNYPEIHGHFHWDPSSVRVRGNYTLAFFTNEHSACYVLTRHQLRRAIDSGGFLLKPYSRKYDLLCTAATDPYTQCGLQKLICVSQIDDFLIHHLPNKYCGTQFGVNDAEFRRQLRSLLEMPQNGHALRSLFNTETRLIAASYSKDYYEPVRQEITSSIPRGVRNILSVGCGSGATEAWLCGQGMRVAAIPLDPIIAGSAQSGGVELVPGDFATAREALIGKRFDCLLLSNVLHLVENPSGLLSELSTFLASDCSVAIMSVPNIQRLRALWGTIRCDRRFKGLGKYEDCGVHCTSPAIVQKWIENAGMKVQSTRPVHGKRELEIHSSTFGFMRNLLASEFITVATKG